MPVLHLMATYIQTMAVKAILIYVVDSPLPAALSSMSLYHLRYLQKFTRPKFLLARGRQIYSATSSSSSVLL